MLIKQTSDVPLESVQDGIGLRWLIAEADGAPNFAMRVVEIQPGITFEPHQHAYEHEIYVLEGHGMLLNAAGEIAATMKPGNALLVPPDEVHGYRNPGDTTLKFICVIPLQ